MPFKVARKQEKEAILIVQDLKEAIKNKSKKNILSIYERAKKVDWDNLKDIESMTAQQMFDAYDALIDDANNILLD